MKSILFLSHHFYPSAAVAAKRLAKFCKYLPRFGFQPLVLTIMENHYAHIDAGLTVPGIKVYRTRILGSRRIAGGKRRRLHYLWRFFERCCFPDQFIVWLPFALVAARQIFRENHIDAIYATGPWFSTFVLGYWLKRIYRVPLVIEYRDQWSLNPVYRLRVRAAWHRYCDKKAVANADKVIFASKGVLHEYRGCFDDIDLSRAVVVNNSFDPEEFNDMRDMRIGAKPRRPFVISYAGNFYWPRKPHSFLQALFELTQENKIVDGDFKFVSMGNLAPTMIKHQFNGFVELKGMQDHDQTLQQLANSDCLLLVVANEYRANIPAKLYEYLALRKPIFALCPQPSAVNEILSETGAGITADVDDVEDIKRQLFRIYRDRGIGLSLKQSELNKYSSESTARQLSDVLLSLWDGSR